MKDIVVELPVKKRFKIKAKIRSVKKMEFKIVID